MRPTKDSKPPEVEARFSERIKWRKHRKDTSGFLWSTWLMLFLAIVLSHDTLEGFRTGQWVDISAKDSGVLVPWWVAAALALGALLFSLWWGATRRARRFSVLLSMEMGSASIA